MGIYDHDIENSVRALWVAKKLQEAVNDSTLNDEKTARFITLTTRSAMPQSWWVTNMEAFVDTFLVAELARSGVYTLEHHHSGAIHAHLVVVMLVPQMEYLATALELWHENCGFVHQQEVQNLVRVSGYVTKSLFSEGYEGVSSNEERITVDNVRFFGPKWDRPVEMPELFKLEDPV